MVFFSSSLLGEGWKEEKLTKVIRIRIPLFLAIYAGHRIYTWSDPWAHPSHEVDLHTGLEESIAEEGPVVSFKGWQKIRHIWE